MTRATDRRTTTWWRTTTNRRAAGRLAVAFGLIAAGQAVLALWPPPITWGTVPAVGSGPAVL